MRFFIRRVLGVLCLLCLLSPAAATAGVKTYRSGVFVNRINSFDVKSGTAEVDLWYWAVAEGEAPSLQSLELSNGKLETVGDPVTQKRDGLNYVSRRYVATVKCRIDTSKFPFDRQTVTLIFEDSELTLDQMRFEPDKANSGIDPSFEMNEWLIRGISYDTGVHHYASSFGYLDIPTGQGSDYSQFRVSIELERRGTFWQKVFKYFWAVVVSVIVGLFALLIRVCDLDGRFGMAVGALFANVGCSFLLSEQLPQSPTVSVAELVSYVSLGFIMVFLIESIISLMIYNSERTVLSRRIDLGVFVASLICYTLMWFVIL